MKNKDIPKATKPSQNQIKKPDFIPTDDKIKFSFSALERNEYFDFDVSHPNWASKLFDMLKNASNFSFEDLKKLGTYRVHNHENAKPPCSLPNGVRLKDLYQIRIDKSHGGIHGVFYENIFYVIWLDPLHNMYPDSKYGGLKTINPL